MARNNSSKPAAKDDTRVAPRRPIVLAPRRARKRSEMIAHDLASYITDENLAPDTALPPEHDMIESLGVGRTTLREALRLLETRGVLTIKAGPGGGPIVRRPSPSDLGDSLSLILQFEGAPLIEVLAARRWLESAVARLAATQITKTQVDELRMINAAIADNLQDEDKAYDLNLEFHRRIGQACGNVVLRVFLEAIISIGDGRGAGIEYHSTQIMTMVDRHAEIIDALAAGDPDAAGRTMNVHLEDGERYWRRRFSSIINQPVRWSQ